jgi:hypothetical protein
VQGSQGSRGVIRGRVVFWIGDPNDDQIWPKEAAWRYAYINNKLLAMEQSERTNLGSQRSN